MFRCVFIGAICMTGMAFPAAGLVALVYRFPVPFGGYFSGPSAVVSAMSGVVVYGLFGGFVVLPGLGAATGAIAYMIAKKWNWSATPIILGLCLVTDVAAAFVLATGGPW